jgi:quinoprotein dehydrogenase-associated probable ABC transporter substrate-binding protein
MKSPLVPSFIITAVFLAAACASGDVAAQGAIKSLTICADPGNMPLSNQKGEGFENKIAEVLGRKLGARIAYYWRPSIERGLMRTTLSEGNCDVWLDMPSDTEGAEVTKPLYRSTFVFAYRNDQGYGEFKSMDDPRLQDMRIGVFQVSAVRQALAQHGIMAKTIIHYLSHNADIVEENQPSYQVQQVIDGQLDLAAAWGPMAGYYRTIKHAPLTIQPVNTIDDTVPLEFDMALAVPRGQPELKAAVERALREGRDEVHAILDDYGVPLVKCDECIVSGTLPSHGPYKSAAELTAQQAAEPRSSALPRLKKALAQGADPLEELGNAIVADDAERVRYLLDHGVDVNGSFGDGYTPLVNATRFGFSDLVDLLLDHKADVNLADLSHWTPLMYAAWTDSDATVKRLVAKGAQLESGDADGLTALGIAAQNMKTHALAALLEAGADVNRPVGKADYTPLMLAAMSGSVETAQALIKHGADVNAKNAGGITPLMVVAANNAVHVGSLLLDAGADPAVRSQDGRTALMIAKANNSDAVLKLLQDAGTKSGGTSG